MDIEGTTTSISFVKDTLFPYVRQHLEGYLKSQWSDEEFQNVLTMLKDQAAEDKKAEMEGAVEIPVEGSEDDVKAAVVKNVLWQMDADRKTTALKKLQGQMWRQGYQKGELKGHLFSDVAPALKDWIKDGRKLYVYSSGSVEAQKLLFGNSTEGDLTELFSGFFDTQVGAKVEAESYKSIVKKLDCNADDVLFLTDLPKEANAAREAGLPVLLVEREGNVPLASDLRKEFSAVTSFDQVSFETMSKKHKAEEDVSDEKVAKKQKVDEDIKEEMTAEIKKVQEETKEEPKLTENDAALMDVESVEPAVVEDSGAKTEAMDVDKPSEEPVLEKKIEASVEPQVLNDKTVESLENGAVEKSEIKEENAAKTDLTSEQNGSSEESSSKRDDEEPKAVVDKESKSAESKEVSANGDSSENSEAAAVKANPEAEEKEKSVEEVPVIVKAKVEEKTEVPEEKTEDQSVEISETDSENKISKEDLKTEAKEDKPDPVVEVSSIVKEPKEDKVKNTEDVKVDEKTVTESEGEKKDEATEAISQDKVVSEEKVESNNVKTAMGTEASTETDNKSEKAEEKEENVVSKESNGEANGNANGEANGETKKGSEMGNGDNEKINGSTNGKDGETNGKVSNGDSNGHSKDKDAIPEVIVTKNAAQIENGSGDAAVVVEA